MKDYQFYPTPHDLAAKMAAKVDWARVKSVLEPSAGKGNLIDGVKKSCAGTPSRFGFKTNKFQAKTIECVEINPEHIAVLKDKGYHAIQADFLVWDTFTRYDAVIMNPPFADGEKHVLKAVDMLKGGGQLCAIINAETLKNPYSVYRKELSAKLNELGADIEYIQNAFADAERKTGVEIALIYVDIPKRKHDFNYFENLESAKEYHKTAEINPEFELATNDIIGNLLTQYQREAELGLFLIEQFQAFSNLVPDFGTYKHEKMIELNVNSRENVDGMSEENLFIRELRTKYWKMLLQSDTASAKMTAKVKEKFMSEIETFRTYDFTVHNIFSLLQGLQTNLVKNIEESIIEKFDELTYSYSMDKNGNIHYYNGWKTNNAFMINRKVIIWLNAYPLSHLGFGFDPCFSVEEKIRDLIKIFTFLNGGKNNAENVHDILQAAEKSGYAGEKIHFEFFDVEFKKKGTAHIYFTNLDLLKKWNIFAGIRKNFLPRDYGKKKYSDLSQAEKNVADSFDGGKDGYADTYKKSAFYHGAAALNMLGMNSPEEPSTEDTPTPATTAPDICKFEIGAKYCYKKSDSIQILSRTDNIVKFSTNGKEYENEVKIFDDVEILKNKRGVTLCWANKKFTEPPTPEEPVEIIHDVQEEAKPEKLENSAKPIENISRFSVGATYATRSAANHECILTYTVISRTNKTIKIRDKYGDISTKKPHIFNGKEAIYPDGKYSMCPVIDTDDIVKLPENVAAKPEIDNDTAEILKDVPALPEWSKNLIDISPEYIAMKKLYVLEEKSKSKEDINEYCRKIGLNLKIALHKISDFAALHWCEFGDVLGILEVLQFFKENLPYNAVEQWDIDIEIALQESFKAYVMAHNIGEYTVYYSDDEFVEAKEDFERYCYELIEITTTEDGRYLERYADLENYAVYGIINNSYYPLTDDIPGQMEMTLGLHTETDTAPTPAKSCEPENTPTPTPTEPETDCKIEFVNENGEIVDGFTGKNKTESELLDEMRARRGMLGENMPEYELIVYTQTVAEIQAQPDTEFEPADDLPEIETPQTETKTKRRPKSEKSHCMFTAGNVKALETMINNYYYSKNYIITPALTVHNTKTNKTIDNIYINVTRAGRYQCRHIDTPGTSETGKTCADTSDGIPPTHDTAKPCKGYRRTKPTATHGAPPGTRPKRQSNHAKCAPTETTARPDSANPRPPPDKPPRMAPGHTLKGESYNEYL